MSRSPSCADQVVTVQPRPATNARTPAYSRTFSSRKTDRGSPRARPVSSARCSAEITPASFHRSNRVNIVIAAGLSIVHCKMWGRRLSVQRHSLLCGADPRSAADALVGLPGPVRTGGARQKIEKRVALDCQSPLPGSKQKASSETERRRQESRSGSSGLAR